MEKRDMKIALNISRCLASCCAEKTPVSSKVLFHAVGQEKKGSACRQNFAESKNPYSNQEHGLTFRVIGKAQILCFAWFYTCWSDGPPCDQVRASFVFILVQQSRKLLAEPHT